MKVMDSNLFATWGDLSNTNLELKFQLKFFTVYISYVPRKLSVIANTQLNMVFKIKFSAIY